jgi:hypothetical protein
MHSQQHAHTHSGFIMVLTLMILSIGIIIVSQLSQQSGVHAIFVSSVVKREQAKLLALSGVQIAMSQLTLKKKEEKKDKPAQSAQQPTAAPGDAVEFLRQIVPLMNVWQNFELKKFTDGVNGTIQLYISCESGKINLNGIYYVMRAKNATGSVLKGQQLLQTLMNDIKKYSQHKEAADIVKPFFALTNKRPYPFNDVTELLTIQELEKLFKHYIFYEPTSTDSKQKVLYLTDLFTIWTDDLIMNPWVLSESVSTLLELKTAKDTPQKQRKEQVKAALKEYKTGMPINDAWNKSLAQLYTKEFKNLPKDIELIMGTSNEPSTFCVISYGTVGTVSQKVCAIVKKKQRSSNSDEPAYVIKKLYWL